MLSSDVVSMWRDDVLRTAGHYHKYIQGRALHEKCCEGAFSKISRAEGRKRGKTCLWKGSPASHQGLKDQPGNLFFYRGIRKSWLSSNTFKSNVEQEEKKKILVVLCSEEGVEKLGFRFSPWIATVTLRIWQSQVTIMKRTKAVIYYFWSSLCAFSSPRRWLIDWLIDW